MEQPNYTLTKHAWTPRLRSPTLYMAPGTADFEAEFKVYFICWLMINKCQPNRLYFNNKATFADLPWARGSL